MRNYWEDIPIGKDNAISYPALMQKWGIGKRQVRIVLHRLSAQDNGDKFVLIRSTRTRGFFKTDDISEIMRYKREVTSMAKSTFVPLKKIRRIINENAI